MYGVEVSVNICLMRWCNMAGTCVIQQFPR